MASAERTSRAQCRSRSGVTPSKARAPSKTSVPCQVPWSAAPMTAGCRRASARRTRSECCLPSAMPPPPAVVPAARQSLRRQRARQVGGGEYPRAPGPGQGSPAAPSASPRRAGCRGCCALTSSNCMTLSMRRGRRTRGWPRSRGSRRRASRAAPRNRPPRAWRACVYQLKSRLSSPSAVQMVSAVCQIARAPSAAWCGSAKSAAPRRTASRSPATSSSRRMTAWATRSRKRRPSRSAAREVLGQRRVALVVEGERQVDAAAREGEPRRGRGRRRRPRPPGPASGRSSRRRRHAAAPRRSPPGGSPRDGRPRRRAVGVVSVMALELPAFFIGAGPGGQPGLALAI